MEIYQEFVALVEDAMRDYLDIANHCIQHCRETDGGYLFPAALMLLTIVDTIGSYYEGNKRYLIEIDKTKQIIKKNHYLILNSTEYYDQQLSSKDIAVIYDNFRCPVIHNTAILAKTYLQLGTIHAPIFARNNNNDIVGINILRFYMISGDVVNKFLKQTKDIIPNSKQFQNIIKKSRITPQLTSRSS